MRFSAKRAAYSDKPSEASQAEISCTASPPRAGARMSIDPFSGTNNGIRIPVEVSVGAAIALGAFYIRLRWVRGIGEVGGGAARSRSQLGAPSGRAAE